MLSLNTCSLFNDWRVENLNPYMTKYGMLLHVSVLPKKTKTKTKTTNI